MSWIDQFEFISSTIVYAPSSSLCTPASNGGAQEITVTGSESQYCFNGLTPDALYNATVYTQTPNLEGPGVSVKERTCKRSLLMILHFGLVNGSAK